MANRDPDELEELEELEELQVCTQSRFNKRMLARKVLTDPGDRVRFGVSSCILLSKLDVAAQQEVFRRTVGMPSVSADKIRGIVRKLEPKTAKKARAKGSFKKLLAQKDALIEQLQAEIQKLRAELENWNRVRAAVQAEVRP